MVSSHKHYFSTIWDRWKFARLSTGIKSLDHAVGKAQTRNWLQYICQPLPRGPLSQPRYASSQDPWISCDIRIFQVFANDKEGPKFCSGQTKITIGFVDEPVAHEVGKICVSRTHNPTFDISGFILALGLSGYLIVSAIR